MVKGFLCRPLFPEVKLPSSLPVLLAMMNIVGARLSADTKVPNDTRAIYLPNQTEQVSQIAIDVSAIADLVTVD